MASRNILYTAALLALCCALVHANKHEIINAPAPPTDNVPAGLREILTLEDGTRIQVEEFPGASKLALLKHMFTSSTVHVRCPGDKDFSVFHGRTVEEVREAFGRGESAWCGWERFMGRSAEECIVPVPVFGSTYVAVAKPKTWLSGASAVINKNTAASASPACSMRRVHELSMPRLLSALMGAFFFSSAPQLAESTPFRLAGGSIGFAALSSLILLFVLYRSLPQRRSFLVGSALFGSSVAAAMRYIFGTWLPSFNQLIRNPIVLGYTALSALMGLAMTYYFNDTSNRKINTMLRVALQLVGLGMLAGSASSKEGAVLAVLSTVAWRLAPLVKQERSMLRVLRRAKDAVQHDLQDGILVHGRTGPLTPLSEAAAAFVGSPKTPPSGAVAATGAGHHGRLTSAGRAVADAVAHAAQVPSPLVERGLILNVETGKTIQIGKVTYNKLKDDGYDVDFINGTITPPGAGGAAGSGGEGVGGRGRGRKSSGSVAGSRGRSASTGKKSTGGGTPRSRSRRK